MNSLLYKDESYQIIGLCMEVHNQLGKGFSEAVYSDALEIELLDNGISFSREKKFNINYKGAILSHKYKADFIIEDKFVSNKI